MAVRQEVTAALEQVSSHMNYSYFLDHHLAFECPTYPGKDHLCIVNIMLDDECPLATAKYAFAVQTSLNSAPFY